MSTFLRFLTFTFLAVLGMILAFSAGYFVHRFQASGEADFPLLQEAFSVLSRHALVEPPVPPALEYGMIRGMLQTYADPYTIFVEPLQHELNTQNLQGKFGGIGVTLGQDEEGHILLFPFLDGPAARAGLLEGDRLLLVDSLEIIPGTPFETVEAAMRGLVGDSVAIRVARTPDFQPLEYKIRLESFPIPSVTWHLAVGEARVGVVKINLISASTPEEVETAIADLRSRGATHFVLDLRDNGGGLLASAVDTARLFLRDGTILQQQYRGKPVETFHVLRAGALVDLPLALLVNRGTASAAEIIAAALKVHDRAVLVGETTFGKDTMQLVFELKDGSSLHVSAGRWWIPGLEPPVGENGLQPDVNLPAEAMEPAAWMAAAVQAVLDEE